MSDEQVVREAGALHMVAADGLEGRIAAVRSNGQRHINALGSLLVAGFHDLGLLAIGGGTVWAAAATVFECAGGRVRLR